MSKFVKISEVKSTDLVKFWNENCTKVQGDYKEIKKFRDRDDAERRVNILVGKMDFEGSLTIPEDWMPAPEDQEGARDLEELLDDEAFPEWLRDEEEDKEVIAAKARASTGAFATLVQSVQDAHAKAAENGETVMGERKADSKASNSDGVAASWADNEVRASRLKRDGVKVEDETGGLLGIFKSTYEAFRALRLPNNKHIRFRLKLKESFRDKGEGAVFEHNEKSYHFSIVPAEEPLVTPEGKKIAAD